MMRDTPVVSGVYFLFKEDAVIYIGQSKDVYGRISDHQSAGRSFDYAHVMPVQPSALIKVERALIKAFRPPQNTAHALDPKPIIEATSVRVVERKTVSVPAATTRVLMDGMGLLTKGAARTMAGEYGLRGIDIDQAIMDGEIAFRPTDRLASRTKLPVLKARASEVQAWCEQRQAERLASFGFDADRAPHPTLSSQREAR